MDFIIIENYKLKGIISDYFKSDLNNSKNTKELEFIKSFDCSKWGKVIDEIYWLNHGYKRPLLITSNSIKLAQKIKHELDIEVFPIIEPVFEKDDVYGKISWRMYDKELNWIYSFNKTSELIKKKIKLDYSIEGNWKLIYPYGADF